MEQAIFSGRFDPMTLGHLDIIERAAAHVSRLIVAVVSDEWAPTIMEAKMRIAGVEAACQHMPHVVVQGFSGLLVDFASELDIKTIIRGLRSSDDFQYEYRMAMMNQSMAPGLETLFLMSSPAVATISSTLVRQILMRGGDVNPFIPSAVCQYVEACQWR